MFGLGGPEVILIFVLALLLFGPRKLPEIGRVVGKSVAELRRATLEFRTTLEREVEIEKVKQTKDALGEVARLAEPRAALRDVVASITDPAPRPPSTRPEVGPAEAAPPADGVRREDD